MTKELTSFAKKYVRLLNIFSFLVLLIPNNFQPALIFWLGRVLSPFNVYAEKITRSIRTALPECNTKTVWNNWRNSHIQFLLDFLGYKHLNSAWLGDRVNCSDESALAALKQSGGLLLTYHTHHQNTMCCVLGLKHMKVSAVAASPADSPLFPYIGKWATRVNTDSAMHFNGGRYVFTNNLRRLLSTTRECLIKGEVVVSLCDFHQPKPEPVSNGILLNRCISPPTGIIEIALKYKVPIFLALFAPVEGKHYLHITQLTAAQSLDVVVSQYFSFLESNIRTNPACWQGWEWFEELPKNLETTI